MALLAWRDRFLLGVQDVSARVIECSLAFGGDPYSNQIWLSEGHLELDNADGALTVDDTRLEITQPAVAGRPQKRLWTGRARRRLVPKTAETTSRRTYDLSGLLELALGYTRRIAWRQDGTGGADQAPTTLAATIRGVVAKGMRGGNLAVSIPVVDLPDIGPLTINETDDDGTAGPFSRRGVEWLRIIADIAHVRPLDVRGTAFAISQGASSAANRAGAGYLDGEIVLMTDARLHRDDRSIQNVFQNAHFESQVPASIAEWGERVVELPDWLPSGNHLLLSASAPGVIIDFEVPRWQETETALAAIDGLEPATTHRMVASEGGQAVFDDLGCVTRLTYSWHWDDIPRLRVESVVYLHETLVQAWILGSSDLGVDTILG